MESITKKCIKCKKEKDASEFHLRTDTNKRRNSCEECQRLFRADLYKKQTEDRKAWAREYSKKYYPTVKERKRKYAILNKDKIKTRMELYQKEYYLKNKERIREKNKKWENAFPEKRAAITSRRRANLSKAEGSFTQKEWKALCLKYENTCLCCGSKEKMTPDHVVPLARGGTNDIQNIQPLCRSCNSRKGAKTIDYRPEKR